MQSRVIYNLISFIFHRGDDDSYRISIFYFILFAVRCAPLPLSQRIMNKIVVAVVVVGVQPKIAYSANICVHKSTIKSHHIRNEKYSFYFENEDMEFCVSKCWLCAPHVPSRRASNAAKRCVCCVDFMLPPAPDLMDPERAANNVENMKQTLIQMHTRAV